MNARYDIKHKNLCCIVNALNVAYLLGLSLRILFVSLRREILEKDLLNRNFFSSFCDLLNINIQKLISTLQLCPTSYYFLRNQCFRLAQISCFFFSTKALNFHASINLRSMDVSNEALRLRFAYFRRLRLPVLAKLVCLGLPGVAKH